MKTMNFQDDLKRRLKDPEFKKEYDDLEQEYTIIQAIIDARSSRNLTQKQLAELTGIDQADISKLERGMTNPSIKLLKKFADGLDMDLHISFTPKTHQ